MNKSPKLKRRILFALTGLIALAGAATALDIYRYSREISGMTVPHSDLAVVLGATAYGNEPSPVFRGRIEYAIELYRRGIVKKIFFTGAPGKPPQAKVAMDFAVQQGVPREDILIETHSQNTRENLSFVKDWIGNPAHLKILIVSDSLHLRRAMRMAQDLGFQAEPAPVPNTRIQGTFSQGKFLLRETLAYWKYLFLRISRGQ